jgi:hypothetical protein
MISGQVGQRNSWLTEDLLTDFTTTCCEYTVTMTRFDGGKERWTVRSETFQDAKEKAWKWAMDSGWEAPKWWQWWRWEDSRP